ncbi:PPE family protein [Mycobacterium asiaticum]|uniref:PPE domain-containing protein n=1 Tax=Mycobacterium asiaticum TaxID=1790 RepID=A0A1A3NFC5_MYCAS|nr:PPE family protein [Mycobacterium asiaticum]OBK19759.1 hypothetical protein A5635_26085 [Mycobacterium asiaticum]
MSFFTLPPEINSLRMFLGAGSAPMLEAAAAWDGLAAELGTAAEAFQGVISTLASQAWQGPAAQAMAAAAAPYAGWLSAAASQSFGAAGQARAVVSAFEAARAATVHPGAVDANRNAFVQLVMSNLFGQNAPLIALAESIYEEMWAADVSAMAGYYANAAAAASQVVPWQSVLQSFPALAGGLAGGLGALANGQTGGDVSAAGGGGGGAAPPGGDGGDGAAAAAGGGGGGGSTGGVASADSGPAPVSYTSGYTGGDPAAAAGAGSAGSAAATAANTGVPSAGVAGFGMMPMALAGLARAGLLGDSPSIVNTTKPAPKAEEQEAVAPAAEAEVSETETPQAPEADVPAMSVLPTVAPEVAVQAAPGEAVPATQTTVSAIPVTGLRAQAKGTSEADEAEETVVSLRPKIAPGEFRPQEEAQEEGPQLQVRGG